MQPQPPPSNAKGKKLLDQVRDSLRLKHYSDRTEQAYGDWVRRYTLRVFHHKRTPVPWGQRKFEHFQF